MFAVFTCICYVTGIAEFSFDDILKEVCMVFFFTSVGFQANLKVLKSGGKALIIFLGLVIGLILSQNFLAVGLAKLLHISPLVGLCTRFNSDGWRSRYGRCIWPGAGGFWYYGCNNTLYGRCNIWSDYGQYHGGPVGKRLIEKKNLLDTVVPEDDSLLVEDEKKHERHTSMYPSAVFQLIIAMGLGTIVSHCYSLTGMTFPYNIGANDCCR